ncbi:MAG: FAD-dependent oxidoreductase [Isosphaeraceae bacterium]
MMGSLGRTENLDRLRGRATWDVVIIGGGATGLGSAVDAAARGYRTLLVEARDFAQGTSSRSTKLIHGGVRYLAQGNIALVREALKERGVLLRNAPHLVHPRDFVVPAYRWLDLPFYGIGLKLYDLLAGRYGIGRSHRAGRNEVIEQIPTIRTEGLHGGIVYTDCQFDDARMAMTLARTVVDLGGTALNYAPVTGFIKNGGRIAGVIAQDAESGESFEISARAVINATGVYVDGVRRLDDPSAAPILSPSQGAHLVLGRSFLPGASALMVPRTDDGRVLFAIPWHDRVLVGTTDTPISSLPTEPKPLEAELDFLLAHATRYLSKPPQPSDILSTFAGLRPLLRGHGGLATAKLSREHAVVASSAGLVTITGGKWTTYRRMATDAVDQAARVAGLAPRPAATADLKLHGWTEGNASGDGELTLYGSDRPAVLAVLAERPEWSERLHPALPYRAGEVVWSARHEAARTIEDVLARRTRGLFLDARASMEAAPLVAGILAAELSRDQVWQERQVEDFRRVASGYLW